MLPMLRILEKYCLHVEVIAAQLSQTQLNICISKLYRPGMHRVGKHMWLCQLQELLELEQLCLHIQLEVLESYCTHDTEV